MIKIVAVVGVRPNIVKIAPLMKEMQKDDYISPYLLHTGQHYENSMSGSFFKDLGLRQPDANLGVGYLNTEVSLIAKIMLGAERYLNSIRPDLIVLVGDVNSTLALALVGNKMNIPIAHIEAGLRSRNLAMQEEYNRILTDRLSEYLFTSVKEDKQNLLNEGLDESKIFFVGNIMIDSLRNNIGKASNNEAILQKLNIEKQKYALITLHRSECVDSFEVFYEILNAFKSIQKKITLIWVLHPRTKKAINKFSLQSRIDLMSNLKLIEPVGYLDMLVLTKNASFVMTDSGGLQEETTVLGVPCLTLRNETERPITVDIGTNEVVGTSAFTIINAVDNLFSDDARKSLIPPFWEGKTAKRIVDKIKELRI